MDDPPKKRRFWQLHLSTALSLGIFIGVVLPSLIGETRFDSYSHDYWVEYGWPFRCLWIGEDEQGKYRHFNIVQFLLSLTVNVNVFIVAQGIFNLMNITSGSRAAYLIRCLKLRPISILLGAATMTALIWANTTASHFWLNCNSYGWPNEGYFNWLGEKKISYLAENLLIDLGVGVSILYVVLYFSEALIRRREARKP